MSDYNFYGINLPPAVNIGACVLTGDNIVTSTNPLGNTGDVVYIKISDTQGVVVVVQEAVTRGKFDKYIYSNVPNSFNPSLAYGFDVLTTLLHDDVSSYKIETDAGLAFYSESYRPYKSSFNYKLTADNKIRLFNGDVKTLISTTWTVFKDSCDDVAYLVSFSGDSFVTLNNKFKSSLEFNIATR
tara:strand:+ start:8103 stop:8657 length:555 start_codon:yes stop_codon:yes gene_type:complete